MAMKDRDFELVASSIRSLVSEVQADLDRSYSHNGAIVLDRLTAQLADNFAARYCHFDRVAFFRAIQARQGPDRLVDCASEGPCIGCQIVYTVGSNVSGVLPGADALSFDSFEEAKAAMMLELDHHSGFDAQLENECRLRIIEAIEAHLRNATGPEWFHSDGSCDFWIVQSEP
jgi:hypothetical protein